jgi:hypothetical protein
VQPFDVERHSNRHLARTDDPLVVLSTPFQQSLIELIKAFNPRYWNQMVPSEIPNLTFNPALLVSFAWVAKRGLVLPV